MSGIPVFSAGTSLQSSGASVSAQIPADSAGMLPLFVRVTATAAGYFRLSQDGASAAVGDLLVQPSDGLILKTCGLSQFSFVSQSGASTITVTPIDVGGVAYPSGITPPVNVFSPLSFFAAGEQGVYFDPNNSTTLFEDAAGTIPTALERPVGLMRDLSGRGNHATSSSTARPTLTRRVNLLSNTEAFDNATVWNRTAAGSTIQGTGVQAVITADYAAGPFSGTLADRVQLNRGAGTTISDRSGIAQLNITTVATQYTASIYVKPLDLTTDAQLLASNVGTLAAGSAATSNAISDVGAGWKLITRVYPNTVLVQSVSEFRIQILGNVNPQTVDLLVWGADLRPTNFGVGLPAYQRVGNTSVNAADYDTEGFPAWLRCSGGQSMVTPSINFTGTDKMTVWAGVRKLSDATAFISELSATSTSNAGAFALFSGAGGAANYAFGSGGSLFRQDTQSATINAPNTSVLSGVGDISGNQAILRVNSVQASISTANQGTGNYGNYPLYLFARNQSSLFFNGLAGPIIVRGAQSSAAEIANAENWINAQQKVY